VLAFCAILNVFYVLLLFMLKLCMAFCFYLLCMKI